MLSLRKYMRSCDVDAVRGLIFRSPRTRAGRRVRDYRFTAHGRDICLIGQVRDGRICTD